MISTHSIIYSFIISFISSVVLKGYEKVNQKEYESGEYVKIFLIVLLSSIFTFYIKTLINPLISSFTGSNSNKVGGGVSPSTGLNFKAPVPPVSIPGLMNGGMNLNPVGMTFNTNKPMF
jgi:hypothetical protein